MRLTDFGISKCLDGSNEATSLRMKSISPRYKPPEALSESLWGVSGDIYGFGLIMYELICRQIPYKSMSDYIIISKQQKYELPSFDSAQIPENWMAVMKHCLQRNQTSRPDAKMVEKCVAGMIHKELKEKDFSGFTTVLLIGKLGAGKSYLGNKLLGKQYFSSSNSDDTETLEINIGYCDTKKIMVLDVPGFAAASSMV